MLRAHERIIRGSLGGETGCQHLLAGEGPPAGWAEGAPVPNLRARTPGAQRGEGGKRRGQQTEEGGGRNENMDGNENYSVRRQPTALCLKPAAKHVSLHVTATLDPWLPADAGSGRHHGFVLSGASAEAQPAHT